MLITWWSQLLWLLALGLVAFLVAWIATDRLHVTRSPYIGLLAAITGAFLVGYLRWSQSDWRPFAFTQWGWGILAAVVAGPALILLVSVGAKHSTATVLTPVPRPRGLHLLGALIWQAAVYGAAEGLLLSVLPVLVVWQAFSSAGWTRGVGGALVAGVVALLGSQVVIVAHHLGYREFRGRQLVWPAITCGGLSLAYLLTMSPVAAVGGHIIMHAGAVLKGAELPPHQEVPEERTARDEVSNAPAVA